MEVLLSGSLDGGVGASLKRLRLCFVQPELEIDVERFQKIRLLFSVSPLKAMVPQPFEIMMHGAEVGGVVFALRLPTSEGSGRSVRVKLRFCRAKGTIRRIF